jgi:hypothetical protein
MFSHTGYSHRGGGSTPLPIFFPPFICVYITLPTFFSTLRIFWLSIRREANKKYKYFKRLFGRYKDKKQMKTLHFMGRKIEAYESPACKGREVL